MENKINPVPEIIADEPDVMHGDFLDNLTATIAYTSASKDNALEEIGADNFRAKPEKIEKSDK